MLQTLRVSGNWSAVSRQAAFVLFAACIASGLAQEKPALAEAKALEREIEKAVDLPDDVRPGAIRELALRVRKQPPEYLAALASNLSISTVQANGREALQEAANTIVYAIRNSPPKSDLQSLYPTLAQLVRYGHVEVSLDSPDYRAALAQLEADDRYRNDLDFTLTDVRGRSWHLKDLRGKVVLINFWATWCPPCRAELPELKQLYSRFGEREFVILAISDEAPAVLTRFLAQTGISYPVLVDAGHKVKDLFRISGIPKTFVYDREGRLAAQSLDRPNMSGFLDMLERAGLRPRAGTKQNGANRASVEEIR